MTIHTFHSTESAYGACQCDDSVKNGDILLIEEEKVVGLAWVWPIAVTEFYGGLHAIPTDKSWIATSAADPKFPFPFTQEQVDAAVALAEEKGWEVRASWKIG